MGVSKYVGADHFPKQGAWLNCRVKVCFHYDTRRTFSGTIVRDDMDGDGVMILRLDDGRHVLATECQYTPEPASVLETRSDP
jgi:hypothetical protein